MLNVVLIVVVVVVVVVQFSIVVVRISKISCTMLLFLSLQLVLVSISRKIITINIITIFNTIVRSVQKETRNGDKVNSAKEKVNEICTNIIYHIIFLYSATVKKFE